MFISQPNHAFSACTVKIEGHYCSSGDMVADKCNFAVESDVFIISVLWSLKTVQDAICLATEPKILIAVRSLYQSE